MPGQPLSLLATASVALLFGYLCGSIPFGLIVARLFGLGDPREKGSRNIGATNILRTGSKPAAAITLLCDMLKSLLPVLAVGDLSPDVMTVNDDYATAAIMTGFGAFLGHIFPLWLRFRGGKGVATFVGVLLALAWPYAVIFLAVWLVVALIARYSSLAALIATMVTIIVLSLFHDGWLRAVFIAMTLMIFWTHRDNIARLIHGRETRISLRR
ncbi:MAG: glycerol-3-phosphate 1-O-acyltransferase PlsY [Hyphomicrobiales bacterium]